MTTLQRECVEAEVQLRKEKDSVVTHELHLERLAKDLSTAKEREATLLEDRCGQRGNRQLSSGTLTRQTTSVKPLPLTALPPSVLPWSCTCGTAVVSSAWCSRPSPAEPRTRTGSSSKGSGAGSVSSRSEQGEGMNSIHHADTELVGRQ